MSADGFALAFFFGVPWAQEVTTVTLWLAALASIIGGGGVAFHKAQPGLAGPPCFSWVRVAVPLAPSVFLPPVLVAVLPAASEAIVASSPAEMTMVDQADMPCCPCCNTQGDFKATACVLKCVALASAILPATPVSVLFIAAGPQLSSVDDTLHG